MTYEEAKRIAYRRLAMRAYHTREMRKLLAEKGASEEVIAAVIGGLQKLGYLNDKEWIEGSIRSLTARKYGPKAIAYKLSNKGIPADEYESYLEELDQKESIERLIETKFKSRDLADFKQRQKIIASLMRKGFDLNEVINALKKAMELAKSTVMDRKGQ